MGLPAVSAREMRRLERNAEELGVPPRTLMGRAGLELAKEVRAGLGNGRAVFFCGPGNNGGDGFAAAAILQGQGVDARVVLARPLAELRGEDAKAYASMVKPDSIEPWVPGIEAPAVAVDCLLGTGQQGVPKGTVGAMVKALNAWRKQGTRVVSCDVPTGLGSALAVRPDVTVSFHAAKEGMTAKLCGSILVRDIGIPTEAADVGLGDLVDGYPVPRRDSHKGDNGNLLVVAGGPYTGAPFYVGTAAYRTGCDLVHALVPREAAATVAGYGPEIMVHDAGPGGHLDAPALAAAKPFLARATALVLGPGLGTDAATRKAAHAILAAGASKDIPTVVDADGLDALDDALLRRHGRRMVLTPHSREFQDLAGVKPTEANVHAYAKKHRVTVLWKSPHAFITDGTRSRWCRRGHPTMSVGGTGDVLAGAVGALLAKGAPPFEAACAAAYLTGCAGEVAASVRSYGATATDVANAIPAVLLRLPL